MRLIRSTALSFDDGQMIEMRFRGDDDTDDTPREKREFVRFRIKSPGSGGPLIGPDDQIKAIRGAVEALQAEMRRIQNGEH